MRTTAFARETFAADRRQILDDGETAIRTAVGSALARWGTSRWFEPIIQAAEDWFDHVYADEGGTADGIEQRDRMAHDLADALDQTSRPSQYSEDTLTRYVATSATNAATVAAAADDPESLVLEWVTMHDDRVREVHRELDGQRQPVGSPFHVNDVDLAYPGDVTAPIEYWINCRCVVRPDNPTPEERVPDSSHSLTAAADLSSKPCVIVALPAATDPVNDIGPEPSHVTLLFLGKGDGIDTNAISNEVAPIAARGDHMHATPAGRGQLGDDNATVLHLEPSSNMVDVRDALLAQPSIQAAHDAAEQFPEWLPHMTLGYPGDGPISDTDPADITFDRLAVWHGGTQIEHSMGEQPMSEPTGDQAQPAPQPGTVPPAAQPIPWYGVLAPEGVDSGDKRKMAKGALSHRKLPLRLTYQRSTAAGHDGSVVVGRINAMGRKTNPGDQPNHIRATGHFLPNVPETDEVIGHAADFGSLGVSVDLDNVTVSLEEPEGEADLLELLFGGDGSTTFSDARVCSASIVTIPAFPEAEIFLGEPPEGWMDEADSMDASGRPTAAALVASGMFEAVTDQPWDGAASRFTPEQWQASCCVHLTDALAKGDHKLPIREPDGTLSRGAVHAAASRLAAVQAEEAVLTAAKRTLRAAYEQLDESVPDHLAAADAEVVTFDRGPGWVTNPEDTRRIHSYWTTPGQPGYADINWGVDGDFDRCRAEVGKFLVADAKPEYVNQTCAQWHHDAVGYWPGHPHAGETITASARRPEGKPSPTFNVVAAAVPGEWLPPKWIFNNPGLAEPTFTTIHDYEWGSHVFGHAATWDACHAAFEGVCVPPPRNYGGYGHFHSGVVYTPDGPVKVGQLSLGGGHADTYLGLVAAKGHYDDVSTAVADIVIGEDTTGIWFSGYLRPNVTEQQRYELLAHKLSGDWRDQGGARELIAVCCVNAPGFAIKTTIHDGVQIGLVAAAGPMPGTGKDTAPKPITAADLTAAVETVLAEREERRIAGERLMAAARQAGVDPASRLARVKERIGL